MSPVLLDLDSNGDKVHILMQEAFEVLGDCWYTFQLFCFCLRARTALLKMFILVCQLDESVPK